MQSSFSLSATWFRDAIAGPSETFNHFGWNWNKHSAGSRLRRLKGDALCFDRLVSRPGPFPVGPAVTASLLGLLGLLLATSLLYRRRAVFGPGQRSSAECDEEVENLTASDTLEWRADISGTAFVTALKQELVAQLLPSTWSVVRALGLVMGAFVLGRFLGIALGAESCKPRMVANLYDASGAIFAIATLTATRVAPGRWCLLSSLIVLNIIYCIFLVRPLGIVVPPLGLIWGEVTTLTPFIIALLCISCVAVACFSWGLLRVTPEEFSRLEPDDTGLAHGSAAMGQQAASRQVRSPKMQASVLRLQVAIFVMATLTIAASKEIMCISVYSRNALLFSGDTLSPWLKSHSNGMEAEAYVEAQELYRKQRPLVEASARAFRLHPYFDPKPTPGLLAPQPAYYRGLSLYAMHMKRTRMMATRLLENGRDDFSIEKDKCAMQDFLARHQFPMGPVLGTWRINSTTSVAEGSNGPSHDAAAEALIETVLDEITSGRIFDANPNAPQPFFLKCCHLTQASAESVRPLRRRDFVGNPSKRDELRRWLKLKMYYVVDDFERPWRKLGNLLTGSLRQGFTVVASAAGPEGILEMKTEVIWGRAYVAWPYNTRPITNQEMPKSQASLYQTNFSGDIGGGARCAWRLAQRVACAIGADQVRVDVFIQLGLRDMTNGCVVNEISLTSGAFYGYHTSHIAKLWLEGHERFLYKRRESQAAVRVYEQDSRARQCAVDDQSAREAAQAGW